MIREADCATDALKCFSSHPIDTEWLALTEIDAEFWLLDAESTATLTDAEMLTLKAEADWLADTEAIELAPDAEVLARTQLTQSGSRLLR